VYLIIRLKLNSTLLKKSEEKLRKYSEELEGMVQERTKELAASEKSYRELFELNEKVLEHSPVGIIRLDKELKMKYVNPEFKRILGIPVNENPESLYIDIRQFPPVKEAGLSSSLADLMYAKEISKEATFHLAGRKERHITIKGTPIMEDSSFVGAVLLLNDITDRKKAEDKLKASLHERELLLQEVYHRVKNNMQIIISLLRLQAQKLKNEYAKEVLHEAQNRIKSMALVHDRIYQSEDLAKVNFEEYIKRLAIELFYSYNIDTERIKLKTNISEVSVDVGAAIPCALIINELVSNALKHAFPDNRKGEVSIEFYSDDNNQSVLLVHDNGVGLPKDFDTQGSDSFGLQLVYMLTDQLHGRCEAKSNGGTTFRIFFPK